MSQQKMMLALALFAGVVAVAQCQVFQPQTCVSNVQTSFSEWQRHVQQSLATFSQQMQQRTGQAMDTSEFQKDINSMISDWTSMMDMSQGVDPQKMMQTVSRMTTTYTSLLIKTVRISVFTGGAREGTTFMTNMADAQSKLVSSMVTSCVPSNRYQLNPQ